LAMIPITPGGLGFVEVGLTSALVLSGINAQDAAVAALAYRVVSYWLPMAAGPAAWMAFRRRYPRRTAAI
ncbi:MAG: flippase-like domain-containing protein, partial [Acidimicrobiales bacterium]|nr:flippase-like domain-containing protein [Acidimicrobiales bacterium]